MHYRFIDSHGPDFSKALSDDGKASRTAVSLLASGSTAESRNIRVFRHTETDPENRIGTARYRDGNPAWIAAQPETSTAAPSPAIQTYAAHIFIAPQKIADQVVTAIEGGISYWCEAARPHDGTARGHKWYSEGSVYEGDFKIVFTLEEEHEGKKTYELTPDAVRKGLAVLTEKFPKRLAEIIEENGDADTADVFIQCCLFGEVVYG